MTTGFRVRRPTIRRSRNEEELYLPFTCYRALQVESVERNEAFFGLGVDMGDHFDVRLEA